MKPMMRMRLLSVWIISVTAVVVGGVWLGMENADLIMYPEILNSHRLMSFSVYEDLRKASINSWVESTTALVNFMFSLATASTMLSSDFSSFSIKFLASFIIQLSLLRELKNRRSLISCGLFRYNFSIM